MTSARPSSGRQRGEIVTLPSGSLRVRVYAGVDPLSGTRLYLTETVPAGPKALAETKKVRTRLIGQIDELRNPRTRATVPGHQQAGMVVEEVQDLHIISGGETVAGEVGLPHPIGHLGLEP